MRGLSPKVERGFRAVPIAIKAGFGSTQPSLVSRQGSGSARFPVAPVWMTDEGPLTEATAATQPWPRLALFIP
jgi:hypothetical protein